MRLIQLILVWAVSAVFGSPAFAQSFHSLSVEKATGTSSLGLLSGKRVLIMVTAVDVKVDVSGVAELQQRYTDLVVLELPVKGLATAAALTKTATSGVELASEATDSTSTNGQLLRWLTHKDGNRHFMVEQLEVGQKFFIDGAGELYGVLPPEFKLTDPRIDAILTRAPFPSTEKN